MDFIETTPRMMRNLDLLNNQFKKSSYKPNLDEFIDQCEINYELIIRLLPWLNIAKNDQLTRFVDKWVELRSASGHKIGFRLVEKARYTTTMMLRVYSPSQSTDANINLMVRLYHDAQLVEVMDRAGPKALSPKNDGAVLQYQQVDEKRQLNRFLGESLRYCLQGCWYQK